MLYLMIGIGVLALFVAASGFGLWRHRQRQAKGNVLSIVSRQHIELVHGGQLDDQQVEAAKKNYSHWLQEDRLDQIEATLVPGLQYVIRVRALAELGTEEACTILEKQLRRTITPDKIEQSWYWFDVAHCLRVLARDESLPILLERFKVDDQFPLVHYYAAETVAFNQFISEIKLFPAPEGDAAVRALYRALEGLRCGLSPQLVAEARLGELIELLWDDHHDDDPHPLLVRLFSEALRHQRRSPQFMDEMAEEPFEQEAYEMQVSHIAALENGILQYLGRAKELLPKQLERAPQQNLRDWFHALHELRADAGEVLVRLLRENPDLAHPEEAVLALGWSKSPGAAEFLRETAAHCLMHRPSSGAWEFWNTRKSLHTSQLAEAALLALRHHPSLETEHLLLAGARSSDPDIRAAAIGSLGWWEPLRRNAVLMYLQDARFDGEGEVRHAARAALARLGERQALQWFRQGLVSDNRQVAMESIQAIAREGITLLWPELDILVDEEEPQLASCAREALEQMQEELEREPK